MPLLLSPTRLCIFIWTHVDSPQMSFIPTHSLAQCCLCPAFIVAKFVTFGSSDLRWCKRHSSRYRRIVHWRCCQASQRSELTGGDGGSSATRVAVTLSPCWDSVLVTWAQGGAVSGALWDDADGGAEGEWGGEETMISRSDHCWFHMVADIDLIAIRHKWESRNSCCWSCGTFGTNPCWLRRLGTLSNVAISEYEGYKRCWNMNNSLTDVGKKRDEDSSLSSESFSWPLRLSSLLLSREVTIHEVAW